MKMGELYAYTVSRDWNPDVSPIGGFSFRLVLVGQILAFYFTRCVWPFHPVPAYPKWQIDPSNGAEFLPWLVLGIVLGRDFPFDLVFTVFKWLFPSFSWIFLPTRAVVKPSPKSQR